MVETDAPFLTPEPYRGRPNKPWYVEHTAAKVAEIKGISFEEASKKTFENAMRFYGLNYCLRKRPRDYFQIQFNKRKRAHCNRSLWRGGFFVPF